MAAKKALMQCQAENGIRERVSVESYRELMEGKDEAGILIAAYPSLKQFRQRGARSILIEDKNNSYFAGQMFGSIFVDLLGESKEFAECSCLQIPYSGDEYLDAVDVYDLELKRCRFVCLRRL